MSDLPAHVERFFERHDFNTDSLDFPSNLHGRTLMREVWETECMKPSCEWVSERHDVRNDALAELIGHTEEAHPLA